MSAQYSRRGLVGALLGLVSVATSPGSAQRVYAYSEPAVCTTFFKPIAGVTFHAGGAFDVLWHTPVPQFGPVEYQGQPNPVISTDGKKKWSNPTANVTCFIDWYYLPPTRNMDANFRWHINDYGGAVSNCSGGTEVEVPAEPYNGNVQSEGSSASCNGDPGSGGSGGGGSTGTCWNEYVYVEESYDGGATWHVIWEGWATVCE